MHVLLRLSFGLLPLALTPLLLYLIGGGYLNFGGGCKDVILILPWLLWSLAFLVVSLIFWWRRVALGRTQAYAAGGATGVLLLTYGMLLLWFSVVPASNP